MDGSMSAAAIEVLVQNMINVFEEERSLIGGLDEDARQLQKTLGMVQCYLNDAEKKSITQGAVKIWLIELEALAFDADNVLDELSYHLLHYKVNKMKNPKTKDKVLSCFSSFDYIARPRNMALRIKQINKDFESMNKMANKLGLRSIVVNAPAAAAAALNAYFETNSFTPDPIFIGRDDDVLKLVEKLTPIPEEQILSIVAIVGMAGIGKTTLTRKLFNHPDMMARFGSHIWIHVSDIFDPTMLFKKILSTLTSDATHGVESRQDIMEKLQEALKAKTYLLVLDDVWNEDLRKWEDFINSIFGVSSTKGNAIIITTRNQMVASIVNPLEIHSLHGLSDEDCWSIIKEKAFGNEEVPSEFETIGRKIARRCQGLPLAANIVGGVLRCKSEEEWRFINENGLSDGEGFENIPKILKVSYDHLPSPSLKQCFAYCSVFPKGHTIVKGELIELWMAEGFLQPNGSDDMEYVGNIFSNVLLQNSLLEVAKRDNNGNVESCVMHDLVHDLACSVLGCSYNADGITPIRYIMLEEKSSRFSIPRHVAKHLRSLFLEGEISDNMFSHLECLHSLTLTRVKELPNPIRKLIHLRNLNISKSWIIELPEWIGELHHLQTIRAGHLWKLPSTLKYLINLRHLYIHHHVKSPAEIGRLTCLQTLRHFAVGDNKGYRIEELGSLNNLKGELRISNLEKVRDKEEALKANISQKSNLSEFVFQWDEDRESETNDESVLESLQPHANANLKKLCIIGFKGKRFPSWTQKMAVRDGPQGSWVLLDKLVELKLFMCSECEEIPTLEHLPNLKSLCLEELTKVRFINTSFSNLLSLTIIRLEGLECLPDWLFCNNQNLSELRISNCPKLGELPDGLDTLNSLEVLTISDCRNLKSIGNPGGGGGQESQGILRSLTIRKCGGLMELPREMVESWAPSLETLSLEGLSSLMNLPLVIDCLAKSTRLRKLEIRGVPKFMATCLVESWPFGKLQELNIDVSVKWSRDSSVAIEETVDAILQGCSHSLTQLSLKGVENWEWVPLSIQHLTALSKLELQNLGIGELPQWFQNLSSLSQLSLSSCEKLTSAYALERLTKLRRLDIKDCPKLRIDSEWRNILDLTIKVDDDLPIKVDEGFIGSCSEGITDGGVSSVAIEVLFQNLINAFKEVCTLIQGLDKDAQQLQTTLGNIQGYLNDAEKKSITQDAVKMWLRMLEAVAFHADNVLDEFSYDLLHKKVKKMKTPKAKDKVRSCFSSFNHMARRRNMALMINMLFDMMKESATDLGLQSIAVNAPAAAALNNSFQTNPFTLNPLFIGRDDDLSILVDKLTQIPEEPTFSIFAILGKGGMGKTTLTRKVFNHEDIKARFGSHIWVHVSQTFDPIMLFKKILSTLTSQTNDGVESEERILKRLQLAFKAKTYLLVLDNVWNGDLPKWEHFINSISVVTSTKGNAIIITTRNQKVASSVRPLHIHLLNGLSDEDCWSIIKAKTFENEEVPSGFEMIGKKIARRCQGSPLTANIVGGVLRCKSEEEWRLINGNWLSDGEGGEAISKILKLSYDHLPSPSLKKCFAYCSIFPKGHAIVKGELIELWMAEGFLQLNGSHDMESVGNIFSNLLLQNSLLEVAKTDNNGNILSCVMHDLVHDLASSVLGSLDGSNKVRYLIHRDASPIPEGTAKYLRSLIFQGEITDSTMFSSFKSLHALTLDCDRVKELPSSITELILLRNLNISRTRIEYLPDSISELHYLQMLNASTVSLRELPSTLKYLISLRHLYLCHGVELPAEIGRLTSLQTLTHFTVGNNKGYQIEELGRLENLKGKLVICNLEKVHDKDEALKANLSEKSNLSELVFEWGTVGREGKTNDESVLEGLQPHPNLSKLGIKGFKGKGFPFWTQNMAVGDPKWSLIGLDELIEITLDSCKGCEEIPRLGQLPNLKSLSLLRLSKVTLINSSFYGIANAVRGVIFPALESVLLTDMAELREWEQVEFPNQVKVFPRLQSLKIYLCNKLECLPSWLFNKAQNLKELDIRHCSMLRQLPDGLRILNSLKSMTIKGCQNLISIDHPCGKQSALRSLEIRDCQELRLMDSWDMPLLKKVCMAELKRLANLPWFLHCLAESPLLELTIVGTEFRCPFGVRNLPLHKLRKLEFDVTEWSSETSVAIKETVDGILHNCRSSLGELKLTGLDIWKCLPESIQHLTALYSLELENSGVVELPEWFGNLKSLTRLCLSNFTKLKHLPKMQQPTTLQELHIRNCPKLRIEYEGHKISHRCAIYFNGHPL